MKHALPALTLFVHLTACAATPPLIASPVQQRSLTYPTIASAGNPREVHVSLDEPWLKVVRIALRSGTVLPPHQSDFAVSIHAIQGSGTLLVGSERLPLNAEHAVVLEPGAIHSVTPDANTDLVLLIHHLRPVLETTP